MWRHASRRRGRCEAPSQAQRASGECGQQPSKPKMWAVRRQNSIGRGCAAEMFDHLDRPLLIQAWFRHLPALPFSHQPSIHSRHETVRSPHPQTRPSRSVLPYRTRHLATASPPRYMTEILPITVSHRRPVVRSWARCRPNNS
jgi:hypothetical protein